MFSHQDSAVASIMPCSNTLYACELFAVTCNSVKRDKVTNSAFCAEILNLMLDVTLERPLIWESLVRSLRSIGFNTVNISCVLFYVIPYSHVQNNCEALRKGEIHKIGKKQQQAVMIKTPRKKGSWSKAMEWMRHSMATEMQKYTFTWKYRRGFTVPQIMSFLHLQLQLCIL